MMRIDSHLNGYTLLRSRLSAADEELVSHATQWFNDGHEFMIVEEFNVGSMFEIIRRRRYLYNSGSFSCPLINIAMLFQLVQLSIPKQL
jgi:hypothetical protein